MDCPLKPGGLRSRLPRTIAEGSAKKGPREFRRYLDIAVGSLSELAYIFQLARDLGLINGSNWIAPTTVMMRTTPPPTTAIQPARMNLR